MWHLIRLLSLHLNRHIPFNGITTFDAKMRTWFLYQVLFVFVNRIKEKKNLIIIRQKRREESHKNRMSRPIKKRNEINTT